MNPLKGFLNPKKELLTFHNIAEKQWILDEENNSLCQIIKLDERIRPHYPNERTFTYKIYKGHNCWTSVNKSGKGYEKYILNKTWVLFLKFAKNLRLIWSFDIFRWNIFKFILNKIPIGKCPSID